MTDRTGTSYQHAATLLKGILGLACEPVAVKFLDQAKVPEGFQLSDPRRYCQLLMDASYGQRLVMNADNIACPAAAWALGLKEPPTQLSTGQMPAAMGIFGSADAAKNTLETMSRLEMGKYNMVAACPLSDAPFDPDVIVIESKVEHLMWVALGRAFGTGGRFEFSTAILQATCVDATVIPFLEQRLTPRWGATDVGR